MHTWKAVLQVGLRQGLLLAAAAGVLAAGASRVRAQPAQSFFQRQRFIDEETRRRLDADVPAQQKVLLEYGGYFIPQWQQYDDVRDQANVRTMDLRLWGQAVIDDAHRIFARMVLAHTNFGPGDSPFSWNTDVEGPNLDQGFYELHLSRAIEKAGGEPWPVDVRMTLGRQFVEFGQGLTLSQVLDGGTVRVESADLRFTGLAANTIESRNNIDRSPAVADHMNRFFMGFQVEYLGLDYHRPFFYYIRQNDNTDPQPPNQPQDYEYDSTYIGLGSTGELHQDLRYGTELVFETGHGQNAALGGRNRIRAFAYDQLFEYFVRTPHEPVVSAQYTLAGGDNDRLIATDTLGGNTDGVDNAFLGFGYVNTGYAFAPEVTNLQMLRLGGRLKPLPATEGFEDLEVGTDFFAYWRQKKGAPVSDFRANVQDRDLGHEVDVYANWKVFSDLSVMLRYGRFWTGDAFGDEEARDYMYAGMIYSF